MHTFFMSVASLAIFPIAKTESPCADSISSFICEKKNQGFWSSLFLFCKNFFYAFNYYLICYVTCILLVSMKKFTEANNILFFPEVWECCQCNYAFELCTFVQCTFCISTKTIDPRKLFAWLIFYLSKRFILQINMFNRFCCKTNLLYYFIVLSQSCCFYLFYLQSHLLSNKNHSSLSPQKRYLDN